MKNITTAALLSIGLLSHAAPLLAEEVAEKAEENDPEIVVTGQGLSKAPSVRSFSNQVVGSQIIGIAPSARLEAVLEGIAGFQSFRRSDSRSSNPTAQGITLRALGGNASSRAALLLDGVPMADPFFGHIPFNAVDTAQLSQIRITRGGGAGPFGAGALAGVIEMESKCAGELSPLDAAMFWNDRGESEMRASASSRLGAGYGVVNARWDRGAGFYTTPDDQRVAASVPAAYESWNAGIRAAAPISETAEMQMRMGAFRDNRTLRFRGADSATEGEDASIRLISRAAWQVDALAYVQARNFSNIVISSTRFTKTLDQRNTPATGLGGKLELRPPAVGAHNIRLGADFRMNKGDLQEEAYSAVSGKMTERRRAGGRVSDFGLYAEDDVVMGRLTLTGGLRADRTDISGGYYRAWNMAGAETANTIAADRGDWTLSWRTAARYDAGGALAFRAASYKGLRTPTLNELHRPFVVFPITTKANSDLKNETLKGADAGFDLAPIAGLRLSLTGFYNRLENAIANVTIAPNLRERQNLPAIRAKGLEADFSFARGIFALQAGAAYTDARVVGNGASAVLNGIRPAQSPKFSASASASLRPMKGATLALTLRHVGAQFENDLEGDILPAFTTIGAYAELALGKGAALVLRGENLGGATIITRNSDGSTDIGVPRTLWAGVTFGF